MMAAFIGVRGGVGASALSSSVAWLFGDKFDRSTALLDLDVHFGTGALALDLEPGRGLTDAIENPGRIDGLFIERAMVRANGKLAVLSAEAPINQPLITDGAAFFQLQEEMAATFECTVIDLPRNMLVQHPHLLHQVQTAVVVAEFTLAATRDAIRILSWLKANAPQTKVIVVANRAPVAGVTEISRKDFENSIERKVDIVVPLDAKMAMQAAKLGKPLAEVAKATKLGQAIASLANLLLATGDPDSSVAGGGKSLLDKIGDFRALLPAKKAK
jgi:pilus assembly protein CpaE